MSLNTHIFTSKRFYSCIDIESTSFCNYHSSGGVQQQWQPEGYVYIYHDKNLSLWFEIIYEVKSHIIISGVYMFRSMLYIVMKLQHQI